MNKDILEKSETQKKRYLEYLFFTGLFILMSYYGIYNNPTSTIPKDSPFFLYDALGFLLQSVIISATIIFFLRKKYGAGKRLGVFVFVYCISVLSLVYIGSNAEKSIQNRANIQQQQDE